VTAPWHEQAIREAYEENRDRLVAYARRTISTYHLSDAEADAEGVVQDAYLKALTRWAEIEQPVPWLYAVITHRLREIRRRTAHTTELTEETAWRWSSATEPASPDLAAELRVVLRDLSHLPESEAVVTYLARVQGWTHEEIAAYRGITAGASRVTLHRATRRLRLRWSALHERRSVWWTRRHSFWWTVAGVATLLGVLALVLLS